jgi:serine-aspartate repeat-containing protein C/D/E
MFLTLPTNYIDIGVYPSTTSIGDQVFSDYNGNGLQDAGEPGLDGVTVELLDLAGNPVNDAGR